MEFTFPIRRIYGTLVKEYIELPIEAMNFVPFSDFYALKSLADKEKYPYLAIFPSQARLFYALGVITSRTKIPPGMPVQSDFVSGKPALLVPQSSLDYLKPKSESFVLIGMGYNFELWNLEIFRSYATQILEQWETQGSIDSKLVMRKWHPWSSLRASVAVERFGESSQYRTTAELRTTYIILHYFDYVTEGRRKTERDLGRLVISLFDAYIEGATNIAEILAVHEACKVKIPGASNQMMP